MESVKDTVLNSIFKRLCIVCDESKKIEKRTAAPKLETEKVCILKQR